MFTSKLIIIIALSYISFTLSSICKDGSNCPGSQTCCLAGRGSGCCPYADAICCGDGLHCCPNGYVCGNVACYAPSQGTPALSLLLNNNHKTFLETSSFITAENSESSSGSNNKENKTISSADRIVLDLSANSTSRKTIEILADETSKTTIESSYTGEGFLNKSKFEDILEKLKNLNNTYLNNFFGCFKDMEPVVKDLITAYFERKEKTETLINIIRELVNKLAVDGTKMTRDCKVIFALTGFAGIN